MIKFGNYNNLKVMRKKEYGYFLDGQTGNTSDDILLPNKNISQEEVNIGDRLDVFVYRDSQKRLVATQKKTKACAGEVAVLKVCDNTDIGSFVDIGLERDVLVPFRERTYKVFVDESYPFYVYVDKSGRLAATLDIEDHLLTNSSLQLGDKCNAYVIDFQSNGTAVVCIEPDKLGIILKDEYYSSIKEGDYLKDLRVIREYEDGRLGLSTRGERIDEMSNLEKSILSYLEGNDGYMSFNDKSDPEDLRMVFSTSKKNFKRTLGTMMKKGLIRQDEDGTYLVK